jgi:arsenate reductase-like glutaredoxin family protein
MNIVIYNNPECGMSRNAMAIIKAAGCNYSSRPSGPKKEYGSARPPVSTRTIMMR